MNRWITTVMLAERWSVSDDTIRNLIRSGKLPAINIGNGPKGRQRFLISEDDIAVFEARHSTTPTQKPTRHRPKSKNVIEYF